MHQFTNVNQHRLRKRPCLSDIGIHSSISTSSRNFHASSLHKNPKRYPHS